MHVKVRLGGIVDTSTVDWYGKVSMVVFFAGCNFRCPFCQNASLIPMGSGKAVSLEYVLDRVRTNRFLLDAVCVTGGEPTLQAEGLMELCRLVKSEGLLTSLDTNGSRPEVVEALVSEGLLDRVALDIKGPLNPDVYGRVIGLPGRAGSVLEKVLKTVEALRGTDIVVELRTTVVPGMLDWVEAVREIAKFVSRYGFAYSLQQFSPMGDLLDPSLKSVKPPSREELRELARVALEEGVSEVYVKTREYGLERVV